MERAQGWRPDGRVSPLLSLPAVRADEPHGLAEPGVWACQMPEDRKDGP